MYAPVVRAVTVAAAILSSLAGCMTTPAKYTVSFDVVTDFEDVPLAKVIALNFLALSDRARPMLGPVYVLKCGERALPDCAAYVRYCGYGIPFRETVNGSYRTFVPYEGVDANISESQSPC